jgi:hypothetical protein
MLIVGKDFKFLIKDLTSNLLLDMLIVGDRILSCPKSTGGGAV